MAYHSVYQWCKKLGIEIKNIQRANTRTKLSKSRISISGEDLDIIKEMYFNKEMSFSQIASHYKVAISTVFNFFKRHDLNPRSASEGSGLIPWSDEKREEYRQRGYNLYLNARKYGTKPERDFNEWCISNDIMAIEQWRSVEGTNHPYDFLLPAYNLIVEIDGHYWHAMEKQKLKDEIHVDFAVKSGYNIVRICTNDLKAASGDYMKFLGEYID